MQQAKGYQAKNGRPLSNEMQAATLRCTYMGYISQAAEYRNRITTN